MSHHADGTDEGLFSRTVKPPVGRPSEQPNGNLVQSEETAESIHFAPPLTLRVSYGATLSPLFPARPIPMRKFVIHLWNNEPKNLVTNDLR